MSSKFPRLQPGTKLRAPVASGATAGTRVTPMARARREGPLELSFAQQRLWFLDQLEPNSALYNISTALKLVGALDTGRLTTSLNALVARHESLRTTFITVDGQPRQIIAPSLELDVPVREVPGADAARELALADSEQPFDLARGPLVRATIVRLGSAEHWLLLSMHHIVSDGWSAGILADELSQLYSGAVLPPLLVQYPDFAIWQRSWLSGDVLRQQLAYWKTQLSGGPELLELPTDRPRPPVMSYRGAKHLFAISTELTRSLEVLSRQQSATMFMTCLTAFATLLWRYSRQEDITVGVPVANRNRPETQALIGFFVNTVVLRADLSGNPTFRELLARVRGVALGAYQHEDLPFEKLVEELRPERSLSHSPLFQVMFALETEVGGGEKFADLDTSILRFDNHTSKFDLTVGLEHHSDGMTGEVEYSADLFDEATIARMVGHFQRLLEAIVADPDRAIGDLPILTEPERHQILVEWNQTALPYPENSCVHELIEQQVDRTPDAIALVQDRAQLTYRELDDRANQLAHHLIELGAGPETRVGLCIGRSLDMIVALLGIFKSGAAYVPFAPDYPEDRVSFMLDDSAATILITEQRHADRLAPFCPRLVRMDADWPAIATEPTTRPSSGVTSANLAYVIYTSGSTGTPKGVLVEHRSAVNLLYGYGQVTKLSPADRTLQFCSIVFDGSLDELFCPLMFGAVNVIRGDDVPTAAELLGERFEGVTILNVTTAYWHAMVGALQTGELKLPRALRLVNTGGDRVLPERVAEWHAIAPGLAFRNVYGPSETTDLAAVWPFRIDELVPGREVPIGRPLPNYTVYVLDARRHPVPVGVPGELYIGGAGVARGYLNRPELTEERFVPNPFGPGRLYRTGDFVRWFPNGNLEFIGRVDHQVKIRGFRVELGEVEAALSEHPNVHMVVVVTREIVPGEKRLVAYVVGETKPVNTEELRSFLAAKLPEYMVPWAIVVLDEIPVTSIGKVDLRALPAPGDEAVVARGYEAPQGHIEQTLAQLWQELLGVERVGRDDHFFELGGHSLLAVQLMERLRTLGLGTDVRTLFAAPTLAALAARLGDYVEVPTSQIKGEWTSNLVPMRREGSGVPVVLAHAIGGTVLGYLDLVTRLAPGRSCFAIRAKGVSEGETPAETIEEMARQYLELLDDRLEGRSCHLVGWSFGGLVVMEMARQLARAGKQVASITFVDSFAPGWLPEIVDPVVSIGEFANALGLVGLDNEILGMDREQAFAHVVARAATRLPGNLGAAKLSRLLRVFEANLRAEARYKAEPFSGDVTLISAADTSAPDPSHGFRPHVTGTLAIRTTPGDHYSILRPPEVDRLAQTLDELLSAAEIRRR